MSYNFSRDLINHCFIRASFSLFSSLRGNKCLPGGSPGLVVMEMTHDREVVGSNPGAVYWMELKKFDFDLL